MALDAAHRQGAPQRSPAPVFDGISKMLRTGGFTDQAPVDCFTSGTQGLDNADGAVHRWTFLVTGQK